MDNADTDMITYHAAKALAPAADARELIEYIISSGSSDVRDIARMQDLVAAIDAAIGNPVVAQSGLPVDHIINAKASAATWLAARIGATQ